jgi:DNA replication protein DnaC
MGSQALRNIPENKLNLLFDELDTIEDAEKRSVLKKAYRRYHESNIPVIFWKLNMDKDFVGDKVLLDVYKEITTDFKKSYSEGRVFCLAGSFGRGKSLTVTNILKRAVEHGYSGLYTTLSDIISAAGSNDFYNVRKELLSVNFLCIDECDPRWFSNSINSADFFGRVFEDILRSRIQNKLPLYLCTNSPNPVDAFHASLKESITSLFNHIELIPVLGKDFRKNIKG